MKSSEDDERPPLRSALRSGPTRTTNRVSFSPGAEPGGGGGVASDEAERMEPGGSLSLGQGDTERLEALTSDLMEATQRSRDSSAEDQWALSLRWVGPSLTWSQSRPRPRQTGVAPPGGGGVSHMSAVLGGLLDLVEQHWTGARSLQRNAAFLGGAYDLLSELMAPSGGGASHSEGGVKLKPASVSGEVMLLRKRLERSEQQLERLKKRLVMTLKENYELKRRRDSSGKNEWQPQ